MQIYETISDWDDAYANGTHVKGSEHYPDSWRTLAETFRQQWPAEQQSPDLRYGDQPRQHYDLMRPAGNAAGTVVFIHGGYWMKFGKQEWSHLASGCLARGWQFAIPGYTLAPEASISDIVVEVASAINAIAGNGSGPIRLVGHSAGGHLVSRMISEDSGLADDVQARVDQTVSISGVHDLRPLRHTAMNDTLRLDEAEAISQSPVLRQPVAGANICCWVGEDERPEFIRQSELLANIWRGLKARTALHIEPQKHHFNVIEALQQPDSELVRLLTD